MPTAEPAEAATPAEPVEAVDAGRLSDWLRGRGELPPGEPDVQVRPLGEGHSNLTFAVEFPDGRQVVLRRPPRGPLLPTAHDVVREYRVLRLLDGTGVRIPEPLAAEEDAGVLGAPFILLERAPGIVIRGEVPGWVDARTGPVLADELVGALAEVHRAPWSRLVEAGIGRPGGYVERQVRRWVGQREGLQEAVAAAGARARELPDYDIVRDWLRATLPAEAEPAVVHGDYKLDNVLVLPPEGPAAAPRLSAILDWEMATVGDPRADLGYLLSFWVEPGETAVFPDLATRSDHLPPREELIDHWARATGREPRDIAWFRVLAIWKLAILLEMSYYRWLAGTAEDPFFARLEEGVPALLAQAREVAGA